MANFWCNREGKYIWDPGGENKFQNRLKDMEEEAEKKTVRDSLKRSEIISLWECRRGFRCFFWG